MLAQHSIGRNIFISSLGGILLIAFISYWLQFEQLSGDKGLLPIAAYIKLLSGYDGQSYFTFPTFSWFNTGDWLAHLQCALGVVCALLIVFRKWTKTSLFVCWLFYLSLAIIGQVFYNFQWDSLLLETTLCSIFICVGLSEKKKLPDLGLWLLWLLLFKLMFLSGFVKLNSGDESWWNGTALTFHYFSQPLPNAISYYFHHLPEWMHKVSCWIMFGIELIVPFLIIIGGGLKYFKSTIKIGKALHLVVAFSTILLMLVIFFSGNYNFFNLLVMAFCFLLIDNGQWQWILGFEKKGVSLEKTSGISRAIVGVSAVLILLFSSWQMRNEIKGHQTLRGKTQKAVKTIRAFRSINSYGLFRVMTRTRPEIIFEGSNDKITWKEYELKSKINNVEKAPPFVAPHQPRFEWQMWFAALGTIQYNQWVYTYMRRILEGSDKHESLLRENPFPNKPPKYMRALMYDYSFSEDGNTWWERTYTKPYSIEVGLEDYPE